ncbi:hypothetical protein ABZ897_08475 [Nonomuraea sp. NPDC046802]|uniref:hypothetical protein n=1 Tax=Nonomuraea sp. NPDC046802 TaxID=3154919 RepID=UPI0033C03E7E
MSAMPGRAPCGHAASGGHGPSTIADQAGTSVIDLPGGHMPYAVAPEATARHLTAILQHPPTGRNSA